MLSSAPPLRNPRAAAPPSCNTVSTYGFDPSNVGIGEFSSPITFATGLRVPTQPTTNVHKRYLFLLGQTRLAYGERVRVTGVTQMLEIGLDTTAGTPPVYPLTKIVGRAGSGNPRWSFADGNVSWHMRLVRQPPLISPAQQNVLSTDSFAYRWSDTPALIFEAATFPAANLDGNGHPDNYVDLLTYINPFGGAIPGEPVGGGLDSFTDIRYPPDDPSAQSIAPISVEGPGALVFFASVWQTNPETRATITIPAMLPLDPQLPEDAFVAAYPSAVYWRVGGSFQVER